MNILNAEPNRANTQAFSSGAQLGPLKSVLNQGIKVAAPVRVDANPSEFAKNPNVNLQIAGKQGVQAERALQKLVKKGQPKADSTQSKSDNTSQRSDTSNQSSKKASSPATFLNDEEKRRQEELDKLEATFGTEANFFEIEEGIPFQSNIEYETPEEDPEKQDPQSPERERSSHPIDLSRGNTPEETIQKARIARSAASSSEDQKTVAQASEIEKEAMAELVDRKRKAAGIDNIFDTSSTRFLREKAEAKEAREAEEKEAIRKQEIQSERIRLAEKEQQMLIEAVDKTYREFLGTSTYEKEPRLVDALV